MLLGSRGGGGGGVEEYDYMYIVLIVVLLRCIKELYTNASSFASVLKEN